MMPKPFWTPAVLSVCAAMTASCAASPPISTVAPVRLVLPETAMRPCALAVLPPDPTLGDLEDVYVERGAQIVACDGARRLAVETLEAERNANAARAKKS
jgi:hypothetical protein